MSVKPNVTRGSAESAAARLLGDVRVKELIEQEMERASVRSVATKDRLLNNMEDLRKRAGKAQKLQTELNANVEMGKLAGLYRDGGDDATQYQTFIQSLVVNIGKNQVVNTSQPTTEHEQAIEAEVEDVQE